MENAVDAYDAENEVHDLGLDVDTRRNPVAQVELCEGRGLGLNETLKGLFPLGKKNSHFIYVHPLVAAGLADSPVLTQDLSEIPALGLSTIDLGKTKLSEDRKVLLFLEPLASMEDMNPIGLQFLIGLVSYLSGRYTGKSLHRTRRMG
jgi:hypothetical protein